MKHDIYFHCFSNNMSDEDKVQANLVQPLAVGAAAAVGSMLLKNEFNVELPLVGSVPSWAFYGLVAGGSSMIADTLKLWVLPLIGQNREITDLEAASIGPALTGLAAYGAVKIAAPGMADFVGMQPVYLGAGAYVGGSYVYNMGLAKWM